MTQKQQLRKSFSSDNFQRMKELTYKGRPLFVRTTDQKPWLLTTDEAQAILRKYHNELSLCVNDSTMVIFCERPETRTTFYVYAGYHELYITTERLAYPLGQLKSFRTIDSALNYAIYLDDHINYCESVRDHLPDYLYEALQEQNYDFPSPELAN